MELKKMVESSSASCTYCAHSCWDEDLATESPILVCKEKKYKEVDTHNKCEKYIKHPHRQ